MTDSGTGDCTFIDSDANGGGVALRMAKDGKFFVYGVEETDPKKIMRAFLDWTTRCLDSLSAPTTAVAMPEEPIGREQGRVSISAEGGLASIVMESDGGFYVNGALVETDDKLRQNFRSVLERMRVRQRATP